MTRSARCGWCRTFSRAGSCFGLCCCPKRVQAVDQELYPSFSVLMRTSAHKGCIHNSPYEFTFSELASATENFSSDCLLCADGCPKLYKGQLKSTEEVVIIKEPNQHSLRGNREFNIELLMLSLFHHPNIIKLIGYCTDGDQRLLVYEYTHLGSLKDHLHDLRPDKKPLDWNTRMKIATGAANGLAYLHEGSHTRFIHGNFKSSNILLDEGYHPKVSDLGLATWEPVDEKVSSSTSLVGNLGYCAPEYAMSGLLTGKADVYSFGVVLLEIITGRKAIDKSRGDAEHSLVAWARPFFNDRKFLQLADPLLQGRFPVQSLYNTMVVACMCLLEKPNHRPLMEEVASVMDYINGQVHN